MLDKCIAYAKAYRHPELVDQTIWEVFEACLVRFDNNKYSVAASAVGRRSRSKPMPIAS
ncbi:hypothetical protein ABIE91_001203 [Bradyrhizobium elkanii]|nr:hypothetical protein [Bradyrhizobium elkanii]